MPITHSKIILVALIVVTLATGLLYVLRGRPPALPPETLNGDSSPPTSRPTSLNLPLQQNPDSVSPPGAESIKYNLVATSSWLTWVEPNFGIKLRYPTTLLLDYHQVNKDDPTWYQSLIAQFAPPVLRGEAANPPTFALSVERTNGPVSPEEYFLMLQREHLEPSSFRSRAFSIEPMRINGVPAIRLGLETEREAEVWNYFFFPPHYNNLIFVVDFYEGGGSSLLGNPLSVFEAMAHTLEFLK